MAESSFLERGAGLIGRTRGDEMERGRSYILADIAESQRRIAASIEGHLTLFAREGFAPTPEAIARIVRYCPVCREMVDALWFLVHFASGGYRGPA